MGRGRKSVLGGGERSMVSLYNKVWFGTEVWDEYGHDILEGHRVLRNVCCFIEGQKVWDGRNIL